ncbi:hypothetical protein SAY87_004544 [Trapa incisa]|uniref:Protein XRI1 n=1 Tax=Trapa incisa TaxID=236973 RepID=A0AAN7JP00_9MYRT|nr:hypothetical protein SAY87_004544 [Trapa incisa]
MDGNHGGGVKQWNWQLENSQQNDPNFTGISESIWTDMIQDRDISYMFDETTPAKACDDLLSNAGARGTFCWHTHAVFNCLIFFHSLGNGVSGNMGKELGESSHSCFVMKRRRMLQFDSHSVDPLLCCRETSSAFLRSYGRDGSVEEIFVDAPQWDSRQEGSCDDADQSTDLWLANCLNDTDMKTSHDDVNYSGSPSDVQIDISEFWNDLDHSDASMDQPQVTRTPRKIIFRGRKSFTCSPPKLASSVAYPFTFIKPCGVHGDVTLNDINQRIQGPHPHKMQQSKEDPLTSYQTSVFSGKPVVGKMKIRTEGGRGSITVIRTKG